MLNQNYGRAKILCCPRGSSDFQKGVSQFMKNDCMKKKAMLSSKTMRHSHLTPRHLPGDHRTQISYVPYKQRTTGSFELPFVMSPCTWQCVCTLLQKKQFYSPTCVLKNAVIWIVSILSSWKCFLSQRGTCVLSHRSLSFVKTNDFVVK